MKYGWAPSMMGTRVDLLDLTAESEKKRLPEPIKAAIAAQIGEHKERDEIILALKRSMYDSLIQTGSEVTLADICATRFDRSTCEVENEDFQQLFEKARATVLFDIASCVAREVFDPENVGMADDLDRLTHSQDNEQVEAGIISRPSARQNTLEEIVLDVLYEAKALAEADEEE